MSFIKGFLHLCGLPWLVLRSNLSSKKIYFATAMRKQAEVLSYIAGDDIAWRPWFSPKFAIGKKQWYAGVLISLYKVFYRLCPRDKVIFIQCGYSSHERLGFDPVEMGFKTQFIENDLIGFGVRENRSIIGYLYDTKAPYYDGRTATDLEQMLNDYVSGSWRNDAAEVEFVNTFKHSTMHKYSKFNAVADMELNSSDVLIMGQVTGDASWLQSSCSVEDNVDLVRRAVEDFPDARAIYYKAHPRNSLTPKELKVIAERFPQVKFVDPKLNFKTLIKMTPRVVVNTSGTGLDAGLAGCEVHAYGTSFYAGWGATVDHHTVPARRQTKLTFEDIFVVTNLYYTRHFKRHDNSAVQTSEIVAEITRHQQA